jgi:hypothetical protein
MTSLKELYHELQQESSGSTFQKIQQYAVLAASTAIAMQLQIAPPNGYTPTSLGLNSPVSIVQ